MEPREASCGLHTQEVTGSSPVAPTIPALANQQLATSIPKHFLLFFSKTYQNRIKTRSVPKQRTNTPKRILSRWPGGSVWPAPLASSATSFASIS